MDKIIRCITSDGAIMAACVDASDIVFTAKKIHHLSRSATAALGRLLSATSIMGDMLKQKDASVNLRVMGDGELGPVIAVGDSSGNVKGYVGNADCPPDYYENGKINRAELKTLIILVNPFAPHVTEEMWRIAVTAKCLQRMKSGRALTRLNVLTAPLK